MTTLLASLAQAYPYAALAVAVLVVAVWGRDIAKGIWKCTKTTSKSARV
jgi:hypothetical protein